MLVTEKSSLSEMLGIGCGLRNASKIKRSKETVCFSFWKSRCERTARKVAGGGGGKRDVIQSTWQEGGLNTGEHGHLFNCETNEDRGGSRKTVAQLVRLSG